MNPRLAGLQNTGRKRDIQQQPRQRRTLHSVERQRVRFRCCNQPDCGFCFDAVGRTLSNRLVSHLVELDGQDSSFGSELRPKKVVALEKAQELLQREPARCLGSIPWNLVPCDPRGFLPPARGSSVNLTVGSRHLIYKDVNLPSEISGISDS